MPGRTDVHVDGLRPRREPHGRRLHGVALVLERPRTRADADPVIACERVGATRHEDERRARLDLSAQDERKLAVVANGDCDRAELRRERPHDVARADAPPLVLEARHLQFILMLERTVGAKEKRPIAERLPVTYRIRARDDIAPAADGTRRECREKLRQHFLERVELTRERTIHIGAEERREFQAEIFGEHEEPRPARRRLCEPRVELPLVSRPVVEKRDIVLGGCEAKRSLRLHQAVAPPSDLRQNTIRFAVSRASPTSSPRATNGARVSRTSSASAAPVDPPMTSPSAAIATSATLFAVSAYVRS